MSPKTLGALVAVALALLPATAAADTIRVDIQFAAFSPTRTDILPGDVVDWTNVSERRHSVNANDGSFDSGDLLGGDRFMREFAAVGTVPYHCAVHPTMVGEIDVRRLTLGPLPVTPIPAGQNVEFQGRAADPSEPVRIERAVGAGFETVATATVAADGTWRTSARVLRAGEYRAASDQGASAARRLLVSERRITVRATPRGVAVRVTPALPYGRVVLQQHLVERFGWWPAQSRRLDFLSETTFRVAGPARVRVVLVDQDGWTPTAMSRVLRLGQARPRPRRRGAAGTVRQRPTHGHR